MITYLIFCEKLKQRKEILKINLLQKLCTEKFLITTSSKSCIWMLYAGGKQKGTRAEKNNFPHAKNTWKKLLLDQMY